MKTFQDFWFKNISTSHISFFDDRPGKLFDGLEHIRVAIPIGNHKNNNRSIIATTRYIKFATEARSHVFNSLFYMRSQNPRHDSSILKISTEEENGIIRKLWTSPKRLGYCVQENQNNNFVYYGYGFGYWGKILNFKPFFQGETTNVSTGDKYLYILNPYDRDVIVSCMNSSLFYWFYVNYSDGHNFTKHVIGSFPFEYPDTQTCVSLKGLCAELMTDLSRNSNRKIAEYKATGRIEYDEFYPRKSKILIDEIDKVLGEYYGFTTEELDYIINYDFKYRMGAIAEEAD